MKTKIVPAGLAAAALAVALAVSCSRPMIAAFGSNSEVVIVTSPRASEQGSVLKSILEREVLTVQYEKAFEVRLVTTGDIRPERSRKNIILLDYLEPGGIISDAILSMAGPDKAAFQEGRRNLEAFQDRWARGQVVMLVAAPRPQDLDGLLARDSDRVYGFVENAVQARLNRAIFYAGEQQAASKRLGEKYGWTIRLPEGYEIDETFASQRVVKILKDRPARMITVYWEGGGAWDTSATCVERKKMLAWEFWDEDEVVADALTVGKGTFNGLESTLLSGTWENKKYTIGGVFAAYCFFCDECGRNYCVDASVFAPGLEKLPAIRELRAILTTFDCCAHAPK
jgi:hypothetical protein